MAPSLNTLIDLSLVLFSDAISNARSIERNFPQRRLHDEAHGSPSTALTGVHSGSPIRAISKPVRRHQASDAPRGRLGNPAPPWFSRPQLSWLMRRVSSAEATRPATEAASRSAVRTTLVGAITFTFGRSKQRRRGSPELEERRISGSSGGPTSSGTIKFSSRGECSWR